MSYFVLARKYRPQSFEDLIGQEPVARTLVNALSQGRVAHAYLFSGPRGTGKTTTARLLARALNCAKGPTPKPCGECPSCVEIAAGSSIEDVLEIDAASNRGIDDIKSLKESVQYAPARSRFRLYIIDEAHQISKDGFNALLKTLEEPPSYAVFMLATTEPQKVPATILSRCQRFNLRPLSSGQVLSRLDMIAKKEGLKTDRPALEEIVRAAGGSMRDALSLLDQVVVFAPAGARRDDVRELLGFLPREVTRSLMGTLKQGEPQAIILEVAGYVEKGGDLPQLARDLQELYHLVLQAKAGLTDFPGEDVKDLQARAKDYSYGDLEKNIRLLGRCLDEMKRSPSPLAVFQVFCLRLAQGSVDTQALLKRIEALEGKKPPSPPAPHLTPKPSPISPPTPPSPHPQPPLSNLIPSPSPSQGEGSRHGTEAPLVVKAGVTDEELKTYWPFIVQELHKVRPSLASFVEDAVVRVTPEGAVELAFSRSFSLEGAKKKEDLIQAALWDRLGKKPPLVFSIRAPEAPPAQEVVDETIAPAKTEAASAEGFFVQGEVSAGDRPALEEDPWVKKVLGHFQGDLESRGPEAKS